MHSTTLLVSRSTSTGIDDCTYPHNRQCHLRYTKSSLHIPLLSSAPHYRRRPSLASHTWPDLQQFSQEGEGAPQPPPRRRHRTQCATDDEGQVPLPIHPQDDCDPRVQGGGCGRMLSIVAAGVVGRRGGGGWRGRGGSCVGGGSHVSNFILEIQRRVPETGGDR